jgi:hypothetical protein
LRGGGTGDGAGSVGGDFVFFYTKKLGPPAALSALLFLLGFFFLWQISVSRSDENMEIRHTSKGGFGFERSLIRFIRSLTLGMNG